MEFSLHQVERLDVLDLPLHRLFAGKAHREEGEPVTSDVVHRALLAFGVHIFNGLKIQPVKIFRTLKPLNGLNDVFVEFSEMIGDVEGSSFGGSVDEFDGGQCDLHGLGGHKVVSGGFFD